MTEFIQYFNSPLCPISGFFVSNVTFEDGTNFEDKFNIVSINNNFSLVIQTDQIKVSTKFIYFKPYSNITLIDQNTEVLLVTFNISEPIKEVTTVNTT